MLHIKYCKGNNKLRFFPLRYITQFNIIYEQVSFLMAISSISFIIPIIYSLSSYWRPPNSKITSLNTLMTPWLLPCCPSSWKEWKHTPIDKKLRPAACFLLRRWLLCALAISLLALPVRGTFHYLSSFLLFLYVLWWVDNSVERYAKK